MIINTTTYILVSVLVISLISLIGVFSFTIKAKKLENILIYLVSFSVGALFGDAFIHLLPESFENTSNFTMVGIYAIAGILFSLIVEKIIHWRHCHIPTSKDHPHSFAYMNLIGDGVHNFIDGLIISASYYASIPIGIATTMAVILHEIPQEIGDFGVLIYAGFTRKKAIFYNFMSALLALVGAITGIFFAGNESILSFMIPFAAGNFIYIAGSDLIPELHKEAFSTKKVIAQICIIFLGILVMLSLLLLE